MLCLSDFYSPTIALSATCKKQHENTEFEPVAILAQRWDRPLPESIRSVWRLGYTLSKVPSRGLRHEVSSSGSSHVVDPLSVDLPPTEKHLPEVGAFRSCGGQPFRAQHRGHGQALAQPDGLSLDVIRLRRIRHQRRSGFGMRRLLSVTQLLINGLPTFLAK